MIFLALLYPTGLSSQVAGSDRIIISEIYPDPLPSHGLPEFEYIELFNASGNAVVLDDWKITDGVYTATIKGVQVAPAGRLILCPAKAEPLFSAFGPAKGLSPWPILNNSSDSLALVDKTGNIVDALRYDTNRLPDKEKNEGGWALEIIDPHLKCKGFDNWTYSTSPLGGTPGKINSVDGHTPDKVPPNLLKATAFGSNMVKLFFDEAMEPETLETARYTIDDASVLSVEILPSTLSQILLHLDSSLEHGKEYQILVIGAEDCNGNALAYNRAAFIADITPPWATRVSVCSPQMLKVNFSEKMEKASTTEASNYCISSGGCASKALMNGEDQAFLTFPILFEEGFSYTLQISGPADLSGNALSNQEIQFDYRDPLDPQFNDLLVTEIMAAPGTDHPWFPSEYLELFNRTNDTIQLAGLSISDRSTTAILDPFEAPPRGYIILAPASHASAFMKYGATLPVNKWPILNDTDDLICIRNRSGEIIFTIEYDQSWYRDRQKMKGYSLEMLDPSNPCSGYHNWVASEAEEGGTPGRESSVAISNPDLTPPRLIEAAAPSGKTVVLAFSEKIGSFNETSFEISPSPGQLQATFLDEKLEDIAISITDRLEEKKRYRISIKQVEDCVGNRIDAASSTKDLFVCEPASPGGVLFNEVLVSPRAGGVKFIELYNCSPHPVDLTNWTIAIGKNEAAVTGKRLTIAQNDFKVITKDPGILKADYPHAKEDRMIRLAKLPTLPNEEGVLVLKDSSGTIIDSMYYSNEMHHPMIKDEHGISLERTSHQVPSHDPEIWKSAAGHAGYATPGYWNSQSPQGPTASERFFVDPPTFSPWDPSGRNHTLIQYCMDLPGFIANVVIYDRAGRQVRQIANNEPLGIEGSFRWDGTDDKGRTATTGYYIVYIEAFDMAGNLIKFKGKVAIASPR